MMLGAFQHSKTIGLGTKPHGPHYNLLSSIGDRDE